VTFVASNLFLDGTPVPVVARFPLQTASIDFVPEHPDEIVYHPEEPLTPEKLAKVQRKEGVKLTALDAIDGSSLAIAVRNIEPYFAGANDLLISLVHKLPPGRKVQISLSIDGIQQTITTIVNTQPYPKNKDDALVYIAGQEVIPAGGSRNYSIDFKLSLATFLGTSNWSFEPSVSGDFGSDRLKLPNSGSAALTFRDYVLRRPGSSGFLDLDRQSFPLSLVYSTDKHGSARQLGVETGWQPVLEQLDRSLARQDAVLKLNPVHGSKPKFGAKLDLYASIEGGDQLRSQAAAVEGQPYARVRGKATLTLEARAGGQTFTLSSTADARELLRDELLLQGTTPEVGKGLRFFSKSTLAYDLGPVQLALTYLNGRQAPDFKKAETTTLGVTLKL